MRTLILIIATGFLGCTTVLAQAAHEPKADTTPVSLSDGRILVYLIPAAKNVRKGGFDVFMEQSTSDHLNQTDYYVFQMFSTRPCTGCSASVGYFAVNKHTADVCAFNGEERCPFTSNRELGGVQRILRSAHHITPEIIKQYRERPIWADTRNK